MSWRVAVTMTGLLLAAPGCNQGMFVADGRVASEGGRLGTWSSTPEGCSRDPQDGLPLGQSRTILTFLWQNPAMRDPLRDQHRATAPDAPLQLSLRWVGSRPAAILRTVKMGLGDELDGQHCAVFALDTAEEPSRLREGRPTLRGTLSMQCDVDGGRVDTRLSFRHCGF